MRNIGLILLLFMMCFSCKKDKTQQPACDAEVFFSADVQPIILNSCATSGCHDAVSAANNMVFETYESIFENKNQILSAIRHEPGVVAMPIGPQLPAVSIRKISCWIDQGALNN